MIEIQNSKPITLVGKRQVWVIGYQNLEFVCFLDFVIWCFKNRIGTSKAGAEGMEHGGRG